MQAELRIEIPAANPLDAATDFFRNHLDRAQKALEGNADSLVIMLPSATSDHDDWRRAVARDLARQYAPKRVNLLGGGDFMAVEAMLAYLRAAPGVTGQYCPLND